MRQNAVAPRWFIAGSFFLIVSIVGFDLSADVVLLKNGSRFEGKVLKDTPQKIVLQMQFGTMEFQRDQIEKIVKKVLPPTMRPKPQPGAEAEKAPGKESPTAIVSGTRGKVTVAQKLESTTKGYLMDIKDAVAIFYADHPNKMIEVSFLPFKLSDEDLKKLREAKGSEVFSPAESKPSPDKRYWDGRCPYAFVKIKFEQGKEPAGSSISECQICFCGFTYANENATETWKDAKARRVIPKFSLSMHEKEGSLEMSYIGRFSFKREISYPAQDHSYSWNIETKACKVFVR